MNKQTVHGASVHGAYMHNLKAKIRNNIDMRLQNYMNVIIFIHFLHSMTEWTGRIFGYINILLTELFGW